MVDQQNETFAVEGENEKQTSESSATSIVQQSTDKDFSVSMPSTATPLRDSSKNIELTKLNLQLISPDELTRTRSSKFKLN